MAQSGRFGLSVRVLGVLALQPEAMMTSAAIAEKLGTSPVMVRRVFGALSKAGLIVQRKGPSGGAKLKVVAREIGLGDVFAAAGGAWLEVEDAALDGLLKRVRGDAVEAMNETSVAAVAKRMRKG